jgi:alpha-1,3-glucosyltransferase
MHASLPSPAMYPQHRLPSIVRRLKKHSSIGSLAERTRGGAGSRMGASSALIRHALDRHAKQHGEWEGGFVRRWVKWMHKEGIKHWILPCVLLTTTWMKWAAGLGSYSGRTSNWFPGAQITDLSSLGRDTPPMFGDYEAQRHWMGITVHLPIQQWYKYDLQYWGLDYPPLTAYVSWLCGKVYIGY